MNIKYLDEELTEIINKYFPKLDWDGSDSSASAPLLIDDDGCIEYDLMVQIGLAMEGSGEWTLTIRPTENTLILYYFD